MIGAVARDDDPAWLAKGLPHDLHRVFVGIGTAQRKKYAPALEPGNVQQAFGKLCSRSRAPGIRDETHTLGLSTNSGDDAWMLMTEIAAVVELQVGARSANDGGCVPGGLCAPAVQHRIALGVHGEHRRICCSSAVGV